MHGFGFHTLALLTAIGFAGPLLASLPRLRIPVIIGELIAGLVVGKTGFGLVDNTNPTLVLLANIGFALVMFVVGTHVRVRDPKMRSAVPRALARAVLVGGLAAALGAGLAAKFGTGHAALYAVLMASSSAALALPVIDSLRLRGPQALSVTAQIAIADTACIVLLPLVIDVQQAPMAALGGLAVVAARWCSLCCSAQPTAGAGVSACTSIPRNTGSQWNCGLTCSCCSRWRRWPSAPTCRSCWRASHWVW
jgi:Kef-type K+ transport system membrane component KefB